MRKDPGQTVEVMTSYLKIRTRWPGRPKSDSETPSRYSETPSRYSETPSRYFEITSHIDEQDLFFSFIGGNGLCIIKSSNNLIQSFYEPDQMCRFKSVNVVKMPLCL